MNKTILRFIYITHLYEFIYKKLYWKALACIRQTLSIHSEPESNSGFLYQSKF